MLLSAEQRDCECGARNAERLHFAYAPLTRIYLSAECGTALRSAERGTRNAERLHFAYASLTRKSLSLLAPVLEYEKLCSLDVIKCGARNAESGTTSFRLRFTHKEKFEFTRTSVRVRKTLVYWTQMTCSRGFFNKVIRQNLIIQFEFTRTSVRVRKTLVFG